jgi:hypothetical protein
MPLLKYVLTTSLLTTAIALTSCSSGINNINASNVSSVNRVANASNTAANSANDNAEELGILIQLPFKPVEVVWKEFPAAPGQSRRLVAILLYSNADTAKIVADASSIRPAEPVVLETEEWFPAELIAQGEFGENSSLNGQSYPANSFFQEPFNDGRISRIDGTDYFVLELAVK